MIKAFGLSSGKPVVEKLVNPSPLNRYENTTTCSHHMTPLVRSAALAALIGLATAPATRAQITIATVPIGDAGNAADAGTGRGGVGYDFAMGKFEVTINQYTAFLNAVARTDTYNLWGSQMSAPPTTRGISRSGVSGSYTYAAIGTGTRPIAYVSWFDAARFVNWLDHGQPTGLQSAATTETGAYNLNGATSGTGFTRSLNTGAGYVLPSADEWYKAGYYQPATAGGPAGDYWTFPTQSNTQPNSRNGSTTDPNSANYYYDDGLANGYNGGYATINATTYTSQSMLLPVGSFTLASSYYGTFDQGGNVFEVAEGRHILGGGFADTQVTLRLDMTYNLTDPTWEYGNVGFRVAYVPEPSSAGLLAWSAALLLRQRSWRRAI